MKNALLFGPQLGSLCDITKVFELFSLSLDTCDSQNVLVKTLSWLLVHGLWRICLCQRDHLVGFASVALPPNPLTPGGTCTHCIRTDSRPAARGALLWDGSRMVARSGRCTAMLSMSQTTGARTKAICCPFHLQTHLKLCQQLPS